jgi:hypothetical protein
MREKATIIFNLFIILLVSIIITALSFTGCASGQSVTPAEDLADATVSEPEEEGLPDEEAMDKDGPGTQAGEGPGSEEESSIFKADGVISDGEYKYSDDFDGYTLNWSNDSQFVYIAMKAETGGCVSVAFRPETMMKNADIVTGYIENSTAFIVDMFSTGNFGPHPPDSELGGTEDVIEFGGIEQEGFTIIEFKRPLKTEDDYDNDLVKGTNTIIWAYSTSDDPYAKHISRGYGEINID